MATQAQINDSKKAADDLWNIYQTIEDMEQKLMDCDNMAEFKSTISMDSFEAIASELKRVDNSFNKRDFSSSDMIEFKDLDGRTRQMGLGVMAGSLRPLSDRFQDYVDFVYHELPLQDANIKNMLKGLVDFRRNYMFVMFAAFEIVSKMKPDDEETGGEKSIKEIVATDTSETLSDKDESRMRSLAIDIPELAQEWYTLATELDSDPANNKILDMFRDAADDLGQSLIELEELTHDIDKKVIPNTRDRRIQSEFEAFFEIQDSIRKYANYYNNGELNDPYLDELQQKVIYKVLKNNTRTNIEELIGSLQQLDGME